MARAGLSLDNDDAGDLHLGGRFHAHSFHREVYDHLRRLLVEDAVQPFRFLDVACGDASATVNALKGTKVAHYHGIDISRPALDLAAQELEAVGCAVMLQQCDFVEAIHDWSAPVDVVWIGQSLHHLRSSAKLLFMKQVRKILGNQGLFVTWEPTTREGEDRGGWLERFETETQPYWTAMTSSECKALVDHMRADDYPETAARWRSLGLEAGFSKVEEVFVAPRDLSRMYYYRA
jgi:SAM-dependent methyltransferase